MKACPPIEVPQISKEDLQCADNLYERAMQICETSRRATLLLQAGSLAPMSKLRESARVWLQAVEKTIENFAPAQALKIAHAYDHLHRLAYNSAPLPGLIESQVRRALESSIRGDVAVDQYLLYRLIKIGINRGIKEYFGLPLRWQSQKLAGWYKKYTRLLSHAPSKPNNETLSDDSEIRLLLAEDLTPFTGRRRQEEFKQKLRQLILEAPGVSHTFPHIFATTW